MWKRTGAASARTRTLKSARRKHVRGATLHASRSNSVRQKISECKDLVPYCTVPFMSLDGEDEGQISYYGCLDSVSNPTLENSWIPSITVGEETFSWDLAELKMDYMPPADNCQRDQTVDDPPVLPESLDKLEGMFIWGEWCSCTDESACNSVEGIKASGIIMSVAVAALASVLF